MEGAALSGVIVGLTGDDGLSVNEAGDDGVYIGSAGSPSTGAASSAHNGFEVAGAQGYGLYVGRADLDGVYVNTTTWHGLNVAGSGVNGLHVGAAGNDGVYVGEAGNDGIYVGEAGNTSVSTSSPQHNGFEVAAAEGYGLFVGQAGLDGVFVHYAPWHGLNVQAANVDGIHVGITTNDGLNVGDAHGDGVDVSGRQYAGYFRGDIYVSGDCIGCTTAVFGLNAGDGPLEPGQIVAIQGIEGTTLDNTSVLWRVVPAGEGAAAVGVVRGKAELDEAPEGTTLREGETGRRLVPRSGVAQPGGYVTIVIYGPMQVRVSAADGPIEPGARLAVGKMGAARALKTVVVEGLTLAESAPTIGIALAAPGEDGLVWVLVNPQ